jgi:DNA-binding NarL/FixJ family response regulator
MKVIIGTTTVSEKKLESILETKGVFLIFKKTLEEIIDGLPMESFVSIIDGSSFPHELILQAVRFIKKNPLKKGSRIILLVENPDLKWVKDVIREGADTVIQSGFSPEVLSEKIGSICEKIANQNSRRRHIRIDLEEEEEAFFQLALPASRISVLGKIKNISMSGIGVQFQDHLAGTFLNNNFYPGSKLTFQEKSVQTDATLVKRQGNYASFTFHGPVDGFKEDLAEYIYRKTQEFIAAE